MGLDVRKAREWVDEEGHVVNIAPFFSHIYEDRLSRDLAEKYLMSEPRPFGLKLGRAQTESAAESLLRLYHGIGAFVGVERRELDRLGDSDWLTSKVMFEHSWDYGALVDRKLLRVKKVGGIEVVFPTEALIKEGFGRREGVKNECTVRVQAQ